ncbi:hypothetical protein Dimus_022770 [Dionaea muscipula]
MQIIESLKGSLESDSPLAGDGWPSTTMAGPASKTSLSGGRGRLHLFLVAVAALTRWPTAPTTTPNGDNDRRASPITHTTRRATTRSHPSPPPTSTRSSRPQKIERIKFP